MKKKSPQLQGNQIDSMGRLSNSELEKLLLPGTVSAEILRNLDAANKRVMERNAHLGEVLPVRRMGRLLAGDTSRSDRGAASSPPLTNRGGKSSDGSVSWETVKLVLEDGVVKEVPKRRGFGGSSAIIDWVNFTISEDAINPTEIVPVTDDQVMIAMSNRLDGIFGFGITAKRDNGVNFYRDSYVIGDGYGFVGHGGQRSTILVMLNGTGCAAAKEGWEIRLRSFLEFADRARITRVDLAHDDFTGETYSVDQADQDHTAGLFNCGGRNPDCEYRGNWKNPNGKGRTFQVGNRKNGKFARIYEKGREQGDKNSEWVRIEAEFKSVDRVIPFDVLTEPGAYLAAAYPAFAWIEAHQERIVTTQKVVEASVEKALAWLKHQAGAYIHNFVALLGVDEFVKRTSRDDKLPACFKVPHFAFAGESIHQAEKGFYPVDLNAAALAW